MKTKQGMKNDQISDREEVEENQLWGDRYHNDRFFSNTDLGFGKYLLSCCDYFLVVTIFR